MDVEVARGTADTWRENKIKKIKKTENIMCLGV